MWQVVKKELAAPSIFFRLFWADWTLRMTSGLSLVCPFANLFFGIFHKHVSELLLFAVSGLCFIICSYLVWRAEHRRRLAVPFENLVEKLEAARIKWKEHEYSFHKRSTPYFVFIGTPDEHWEDAMVAEYKDRILTARRFYEYTDSAKQCFGLSPRPPLVQALDSNRGALNGNQLDELITKDQAELGLVISRIKSNSRF